MDRALKKSIKDYYRSLWTKAAQAAESLSVLQANNMIFPDEEIEHDELIVNLLKERDTADKQSVVASFLIGLENRQPEKRAALSAYAISLNFPAHSFTSAHGIQCDVCGAFENKKRNMTLCNLARYSAGVSGSGSPEDVYVFLREHNKASIPQVQSILMLEKVLAVLRTSDPDDKPVTMEKKIRAIAGIDMDQEQSRGLLDLLGQIGILETGKHKGFVHQYTYMGLAPRKSSSTDWSYPVDFWTGKEGVNEDAVNFWFGDYL